MSIAKFSVKNPVLVNLMMIALFIIGFGALLSLPTELNPPVPFNWVFITVPYPGASPTEVENLIIDPIEAEIDDIDNIDKIESTAYGDFGFVLVKFEDMSESEFREHYVDLKAEFDKVSFPDETEDPIIEDFDSEDFLPIINVNLAFDIPEENAQKIAEDLEDDLEDLNGIQKIQISGMAKREIWVQVNPVKLYTLGVTFEQIIGALKQRNLNVPGGNITLGKREFIIRSVGEYKSIDEIENTVLSSTGNGKFIKLKDVARVVDTREDMNILSRLNGEQSISFSISKKSSANSLEIIDEIKAVVAKYEQKVPDGVFFSFTFDNSVYILRIVNVLENNALTGMLLIFAVLYLFLGGYNSLLAALGIPISFFITFIFMYLTNNSMNGSTLFALVMVLGIIVDDAIIVLENCHRYRLLGYNSHDAAILGTNEVIKPIIASIATNIVAFLPLILLPGIVGKFMRIIPIVFSLALLASMFEAFILLPSHYADWTKKSGVFKKGEKKFFKVLREKYEHLLIKTLRWRYLVVVILIIIFGGSVFSIKLLGIEMFGDDEMDQFSVFVKMPEGTSLDETDRIMRKYEEKAMALPKDAVKDVIVNVGLLQSDSDWQTKKSVGQMLLQLHPTEQREISTDSLLVQLRSMCSDIAGPISVDFKKMSGGPPEDKPIAVKVQGKYYDEIKIASNMLIDSIRTLEGAVDITDNYPPGKEELKILVNDEKAAMYGFNPQYLAFTIRYAFDGVEATEFRDGDEEVDVIVRYEEKYRSSLDDVLNLKVTNMTGQTVTLRDMVEFERLPGKTELHRFDQKRTILVTGNINEAQTSLDRVNLKLMEFFPKIQAQVPGIEFEMGGQFEEFSNVFNNISILFAGSILLMFIILGTQFNSYSQPLIILTTVPFALIGAILGLVISGNPFGIISMFGFVALAGIVVNDAIVLITFLNDRRSDNMSVTQIWRSIIDAGRLRLRPIILTSMTTIFGLLPMAFGIGGMSEMWSPLANVILFGLLVSTVLTLFIIPSFIAIIDDLKKMRKKARAKTF